MQIITDSTENINIEKSAVTIGTFDGLHVGHFEILETLKLKAKELNLKSVVITFYPHPRTVLAKDFNLKLLTPIDEKKELFGVLGIDYLYIITFTKDFSKQSYKEFLNNVLIDKVNCEHLVLGYDHKFGNNRDGDINKLIEYSKEIGIGMTVVEPKEVDNHIVSSTKIRKALQEGRIEDANKMLGRYYFLEGSVIEGAKRGRIIGFPTANLNLKENNKLLPCNGVYFVRIKHNDSQYFGVANIGLRPTFNHVKEPITEVHIFDFSQNIYGNELKVEFINRLRNEKKFSSKEELEENIKLDVVKATELIKELNK
jgi:riboflavin kinase/FMN adenylyltransferase